MKYLLPAALILASAGLAAYLFWPSKRPAASSLDDLAGDFG